MRGSDTLEGCRLVARINCAHEDPAAGGRMIGNVRAASAADWRQVFVSMDLPGPKLSDRTNRRRTGSGPCPRHASRKRRVVAPARIWLTSADASTSMPRTIAVRVDAECVMLNKGPHILEAIHALDDILAGMGEVQRKSRTLMRHHPLMGRAVRSLRCAISRHRRPRPVPQTF